jgi:hypothetical protein
MKVLGEKEPASCPVSVVASPTSSRCGKAVACGAVAQWGWLMMDTQYLYLALYYVAFVTGIAGGCFANRFGPSGKRALVIGLIPWLSLMLIDAPRFLDIYCGTGLSHRFC